MNFNAIDKMNPGVCAKKKGKTGLLLNKEAKLLKTLVVTTSLKITEQDFKAGSGWAVRFLHHNVLGLLPRAA
jgi:hypothetical protein